MIAVVFNPAACRHVNVNGFRSKKWEYDPYDSKNYVSFAAKIGPQFIQAVSDVVASVNPISVSYIDPQSGYKALRCLKENGDATLVVWGVDHETHIFWVGTVFDLKKYIWHSQGVNIVHSYPIRQRQSIEASLSDWLK